MNTIWRSGNNSSIKLKARYKTMTEKQANQEGLRFTGYYGRSKEDAKVEAQTLRIMGYRAVLVTVPDSPLSRGGRSTGYSVYAEKKYFDYKRMKDIEMHLANSDEWKQHAYMEYLKRVKEIDDKINNLKKELDYLKKRVEKED